MNSFIFKFHLTEGNYVIYGEKKYFLFWLPRFCNRLILTDDACPHRGGPLHLGKLNKKESCIICPWHNNTVKEEELVKRSVPLVRVKSNVSALFRDKSIRAFLLLKRTTYNK